MARAPDPGYFNDQQGAVSAIAWWVPIIGSIKKN